MRSIQAKFFYGILVFLFCLAPSAASAEEFIAGVSNYFQEPMEFAIQHGRRKLIIPCNRWIYANGRITPGSPVRLRALLDKIGDERILIALNSSGGDYEAAIQMGRIIRDHVLPVTIASSQTCEPGARCKPPELSGDYASCDYACVFVLLGGSTRTASDGRDMILPRLTDPDPLPEHTIKDVRDGDAGELVAIVDRYLTPSSLSPDLKYTILNTPNDGWHYVDAQQALSGRLVTGYNTIAERKPVPEPKPASAPAVAAPAILPVLGPPNDVRAVHISGAASTDQPPMDFVLFERAACSGEPNCGRWISAEGRIGPDTPAAFKAFLKKRKLGNVPLMLNSAGGDYAAAMEMGGIARDRNMKVGVAASIAQDCPATSACRPKLIRRKVTAGQVDSTRARCDFSCLFILAGGVNRSVNKHFFARLPYVTAAEFSLGEGAREGYSIAVTAEPDIDGETRARTYLIQMLWDAELFVALARPGNNIVERTGSEILHRYGLANTTDDPEMLLKPEQPVVPSIIGGAPMQFVVSHSTPETCKPQCRRWIVADGTITDNSPARLQKLLKSLGKEKLPIVVQSDGGSVGAAMKMGIMIREAGLDVAVGRTEVADCSGLPEDCLVPAPGRSEIGGKLISGQAVCASACPLMLAGGKRRYASPWSFLVVHTIFDISPDDKNHPKPEVERIVEAPKSIRKPITRYFKAMGVDPKLFDVMRSASPTSFRIVAPDEALALRLTTHKAPASELVGLAE